MRRLSALFLVLGLVTAALPAHAFLVNYKFKGILNYTEVPGTKAGDKFSGTVGFDPDVATPAEVDLAPSMFDLPIQVTVYVGDYTIQAKQGPSNYFIESGLSFRNMIVGNVETLGSVGTGGNMDLDVGGTGLFASKPLTSLTGANWAAVDGKTDVIPEAPSGVYFDWYSGGTVHGASGGFTKFEYQDAAPVPEPVSAALLGTALLSWGGFRRFRRRKNTV